MRKFYQFKTSVCILFLFSLLLCTAAGCAKKQLDLFSYVSELRDNVLLAELPRENGNNENESRVSLTVQSYLREQPYIDDGAAGTTERIAIFYFSEEDGSNTYIISFNVPETAGRDRGGEMSYDDAKKQYYYTCSLNLSEVSELPVTVKNSKTGKEYVFTAKTVKTQATLSPKTVLAAFESAESETLAPLKSEYDFTGEIRIRLIESDGKTYYYLGIIATDKTTVSYLLDGETAKILAKRESK